MENLDIYNSVRSVPGEAQKKIQGGRLSGKTDINPMWRIKTLTELFGPVGIGWYYEIDEKRLELCETHEVACFVQISLFVKTKDSEEWSKPIVGVGGSMFVADERNGPYVSDECFKMALTDAISVSCKALGIGADVYWDKDATKYQKPEQPAATQKLAEKPKPDFKPAWLEDEDRMKKTFAWLFEAEEEPSVKMRSAFLISDELLSEVIKRYEKYMNDGESASNNG